MSSTIARRDPVAVWYVAAEGGPPGAPAAFADLERRIGSLRGRKFFGTFLDGEYRACVAIRDSDAPELLGLPRWTIPGGRYARRAWKGEWDCIGSTFDEMAKEHAPDPARPTIEYYRRENEVVLFLPVGG